MSFITRVSPLTTRVATSVGRTTTPAFSIAASRSLTSTAKKEKGPVDVTKDTLKKAERTASDAALKGIETGEHARDKVRETVGSTKKEAETKGKEVKDDAAQRAEQGKGKTEQAYNETKQKASEATG